MEKTVRSIGPIGQYLTFAGISSHTPLIFFLLFFVLSSGSLAQEIRFDNYLHLTTEDGLPNNFVYEFAEDKYGFIWIGTRTGLARYDGSRCIRLDRMASDSIYLPDQAIFSLLARGDSLWIGTRMGLTIFDLRNRAFSNYLLDAYSPEQVDEAKDRYILQDIYEDRQGNVWLAPNYGGFVKWDKHSKEFSSFSVPYDETLPISYPQRERLSLIKIAQDVEHDSIIWATSMVGLIRLNQETGEVQRIMTQEGDEQLNYHIHRQNAIYQTPDGLIYIGSWNSGLSIYDPSTGKLSIPSLAHPDKYPYVGWHIISILPGEEGDLYLTYTDKFVRYRIKDHHHTLIKKNIIQRQRVNFGAEFIDSEGRAWFGSGRGVVVSDPLLQQFGWVSLAGLNPTIDEMLPRGLVEDFYPGYLSLVGQYTDGLYHVNLETGHQFKQSGLSLLPKERDFQVWGINQLDENTLLLAEQQGLYVHRRGSSDLQLFSMQAPVRFHWHRDVIADRSQRIWIGTRKEGLYSIDMRTKEVSQHAGKLAGEHVAGFFKDSQDNIWMKSRFGHVLLDMSKDSLIIFDNREISDFTFQETGNFCECPNGELWVSGYGDGLGKLVQEGPGMGRIEKIPIHASDGGVISVARIACNQNNELWATDGGALYRLNRKDWSYTRYSFSYGMDRPSDLDLFRFLKNGHLFLAARDGFYAIDIDHLRINDKLPQPYVIEIISNKGPKNTMEDHMNQVPISLSPDENVITIEFSGINHTMAERDRYQYRLKGLEEEWMDPGQKRSVTYAYLAGGDYSFQLRAANNEGIRNPDMYEIDIHVGTPWYKTYLFWMIMIGFLATIIYLYYQDRINQLKLTSTFEQRVADLEMRALRAQMNPHFIFNCLNSIDAYIIKNDSRKASEYLNNFSRLVRLILQNSRNAYVGLQEEIESLELYIKLEQMRLRHSFEYTIMTEPGFIAENYEIPPMLIQPYVENAIWHGLNNRGPGGKVTVRLSTKGDNLICIIQDNGIGRAAAAEIRAAKKVKRKSMGMGITTERIDIINKLYETDNRIDIIDLYDEEGKPVGTKVILRIPL